MTGATRNLRHYMARLFMSGLLATLCILPSTAEAKKKPKSPLEQYRVEYLARVKSAYAEMPDIAKCKPGSLSDAEKAGLLDTVNDMRRLHGLNPIVYDPAFDDQQMQTALIMAANGRLNHAPPEDWKCYSAKGAVGASTSNLSGGVISPMLKYYSAKDQMIGWLIDNRNIKGGIGHRQWLLNPYMTSITYGSVAGPLGKEDLANAAAVRVFDGKPLYDFADTSDVPFEPVKIIAYPYGDYPAKYYEDGATLSVALQLNSNNRLNAGVDFSATQIHLSEAGGDDLPLTGLSYDPVFTGLPVTLQFNPGALKRDVPYSVCLEGVLINGQATEISYGFRLVP